LVLVGGFWGKVILANGEQITKGVRVAIGVTGVKAVAHSGVFFADPVFWPFSSCLQDFDLLGGKVDRPAASVLISDNFVHFLDLVAFGTIPSGVVLSHHLRQGQEVIRTFYELF
jgi:hypothetical protein